MLIWAGHSTVFVLSAHRDQVYLVSLRESYRNEIIPYRVRHTHTREIVLCVGHEVIMCGLQQEGFIFVEVHV